MASTSARLNILRLNAGRLNFIYAGRVDLTPPIILIEGVPVTARVRKAGLAIRDILNAPNLCTFTIEGTAPTVGQEVRISLYDQSPANVLFGGTIDTVAAFYEALPEHRAWTVTCQDYTLGLNRRKVRIRYGQQGAHLIALDLLARYAPADYTGAAIVQPLPTVTGGIDFTEEDLSECFARLAQRIGGYWYVDYERAVHLFLTEALEAPDPIVPGGRLLLNDPPITQQTDVTQIRTRVYVEGGGSVARVPIAPGATAIPVVDASWYSGTGGLVVSGPQRIAYMGKGASGGPSAPTLAVTGDGSLSGTYSWKYTHVIAGNEATLSAPSALLTTGKVTRPAVAPVVIAQTAPSYLTPPPYTAQTVFNTPNAGSLPAGTYEYWSTFWNAYGETLPSPDGTNIITFGATSFVTLQGLPAAPAGATNRSIYRSSVNGNRSTARLVVTQIAGATNYTDTVLDANRFPTQMPTANTTAPGLLATGRADWIVTFITALGETLAGPAATITIGAGVNGVQLTGIPTSPDARVTGRRIYRSKRNAPSTFFLEATIANNTATTYLSTMADASLGAAYPNADTSGPAGAVTVTGITAGPAGTTARRLYRTDADGTVYKLVVVLSDNVTTSYLDTKADSALGAAAAGETVLELTGIPASGTGAVVLDIAAGEDVNLLVRCDDTAAQAALAALEGPPSDGIVEHFIQDRRLSLATATATGNADLALFARPIQRLTYATHDRKTAAGKPVSVNLPPLALAGTFTIQHVTIDQLGEAPSLPPRYSVEASSVRFSLEDVLRRLQLEP